MGHVDKAVDDFAKGYMEFMEICRTERAVVEFVEAVLKRQSFVEIGDYNGGTPSKVLSTFRGKSLMAVKLVGDLKSGLNLVVSHIDSPRLDLKPKPLVENEGMAMFKTHYYGGIKKYHWLNIPLAIVGVIVKENGEVVKIDVGLRDDDPVFVISDLLPHLDRKDEKVSEKFNAEKLNLIVGTIPLNEDEKEAVKKNVLKILENRYGVTEEDLVSADLEIAPAFGPREVGFDGSMIGAYGQDDRICVYTSLMALIESKPKKNVGIILFDREEIGSEGNTGAKSRFYLNFLRKLLKKMGEDDVEYALDEVLERTNVISADVNAALNPDYKDVHDPSNAARLGKGIVLTKYTGSRGKAGASEARAEFVARVRNVLNSEKVAWQVGTLGKVDVGGGGTVAKFLAEKGCEVVDMGPALLGMHSPFEISSKFDLYETYRAYRALMEKL